MIFCMIDQPRYLQNKLARHFYSSHIDSILQPIVSSPLAGVHGITVDAIVMDRSRFVERTFRRTHTIAATDDPRVCSLLGGPLWLDCGL